MDESSEILIQREILTEELFNEAIPLLKDHAREACDFQGRPIDPDLEKYLILENAGTLRIYTARKNNKLIGYSIYVISYHLNYKKFLQSNHCLAYIDPNERGFGTDFLKWCEEEMKKEGTHLMFYSTKPDTKFHKIVSGLGTRLFEYTFFKEF